jgi:carbamoyl-phosphate synthase large subunit
MDYITVKVPTWSDSRFPGIDTTLSTTMRSTGESMGIGASFAEALCKAARGASVLSIRAAPAWDGWFTAQVAAIDSATRRSASLAAGDLRAAKLLGVSDAAIAARRVTKR